MMLSRTEELKTKLAGGAAAIAIEAGVFAALLYGLAVNYTAPPVRKMDTFNVPQAPPVVPLPPDISKPLERVEPTLVEPIIRIDRPIPPEPIIATKPLEILPLPDPVVVARLPEPAAVAKPTEPVRIKAGFDPRYAAYLQPDYPSAARRADMEGTVELRVLVGVDGRIKQAEVRRSSGHELLDRAAMEHALKKWRCKPAMQDGAAVESWISVPITFELKRA